MTDRAHHPKAESTQILVAGAGPVGLFGALFAARLGLEVIVLEQSFRGYNHGFASLLHPSSVDLLSEVGLSETVRCSGCTIDQVRLQPDGADPLTLELRRPAVTIAQSVLEETLLKELRHEGVEIRSPYRATSFTRDGDRVRVGTERRELVTIGSPAEYTEWQPVESGEIEAQFVIGADGYESCTREALGVRAATVAATETFAIFEGSGGEASTGSQAIELRWASELGSITSPLPNHRTRWGFQLGSDFTLSPDLEHLRSFISQRAPGAALPDRVDWSCVTHFERRIASSFGRGRIWLAGDAAHVTAPFGAQSMNGGLTEARELGACMADCVAGKRPIGSLEHIGMERQREWQRLLGLNTRVEVSPDAPKWVRELAPRIVSALPASGEDLHELLFQIGLTVY